MDILHEILTPYSLATIGSAILQLLLAFVLGVIIAAVYHWTHPSISARSFTDTLIILCMLIAVVMVVIGDSVARAFSLVGALSIIRFRTVVQDPRDIAFVFFSLAIGMAVGASDPPIAILGTFLISGIILALHRWHLSFPNRDGYTITFSTELQPGCESIYREVFDKYLISDRIIRQRTEKSDMVQFRFYVKFKQAEAWIAFVQELSTLEGLKGVRLTKE